METKKITSMELNDAQARTVERLLRLIKYYNSFGDSVRHEFKEIELTKFDDSRSVFLKTVFGRVGDEGTTASIWCRDYRIIMIGPRGGMDLLNEKIKGTTGERVAFAPTR